MSTNGALLLEPSSAPFSVELDNIGRQNLKKIRIIGQFNKSKSCQTIRIVDFLEAMRYHIDAIVCAGNVVPPLLDFQAREGFIPLR
jgi:hypothetical protein